MPKRNYNKLIWAIYCINISLFILDRCFLVPHPPIPSGSFLFKTFHFIIINGTAQYSEALFIELLESIVFGFCCVAISLSLSIYLSLSFSLINAFARKSLCEWNFYLKKVGLRSSSSSYVRNVFYVHNTYIYIYRTRCTLSVVGTFCLRKLIWLENIEQIMLRDVNSIVWICLSVRRNRNTKQHNM